MQVMAETLKLVGKKIAGGVTPPLLPSFTKEQFENYILRGNAADFGGKGKKEDSEEDSRSEVSDKEEEKADPEDEIPQLLYRIEKCNFRDTSAKNHSVDILVTDIPYNVR